MLALTSHRLEKVTQSGIIAGYVQPGTPLAIMAQNQDTKRDIEPRLSAQLAELRERLRAGTHHGETFEVTATNRELEEAITWYLERHPHIPFGNPQVSIDTDAIEARAETQLGRMRFPVSGRAGVFLHDGVPIVTVDHLQMGKARLPDFMLLQIEDQLNKRLAMGEEDLNVTLEEVELEEGQLSVRGKLL